MSKVSEFERALASHDELLRILVGRLAAVEIRSVEQPFDRSQRYRPDLWLPEFKVWADVKHHHVVDPAEVEAHVRSKQRIVYALGCALMRDGGNPCWVPCGDYLLVEPASVSSGPMPRSGDPGIAINHDVTCRSLGEAIRATIYLTGRAL